MKKEARTGFVKDGGTRNRNCHLCQHMKGSVCVGPVMVEWSRQPRDKRGKPFVSPNDICDYFKSNWGREGSK